MCMGMDLDIDKGVDTGILGIGHGYDLRVYTGMGTEIGMAMDMVMGAGISSGGRSGRITVAMCGGWDSILSGSQLRYQVPTVIVTPKHTVLDLPLLEASTHTRGPSRVRCLARCQYPHYSGKKG